MTATTTAPGVRASRKTKAELRAASAAAAQQARDAALDLAAAANPAVSREALAAALDEANTTPLPVADPGAVAQALEDTTPGERAEGLYAAATSTIGDLDAAEAAVAAGAAAALVDGGWQDAPAAPERPAAVAPPPLGSPVRIIGRKAVGCTGQVIKISADDGGCLVKLEECPEGLGAYANATGGLWKRPSDLEVTGEPRPLPERPRKTPATGPKPIRTSAQLAAWLHRFKQLEGEHDSYEAAASVVLAEWNDGKEPAGS